jgi:uncharacterized protein (TIGR01244 family)
MALPIRNLSGDFAVTGQLAPQDLQEVASLGFATVINNRPDGEGGVDQPSSGQLEQAAREAGLHYLHLPVVSGAITPEQVLAMQQALAAGRGRPVLAFCRSGARSTKLFELAQAAG